MHLLRGEISQARESLRRAVRAEPGVATYWGNLGCACLLARDFRRAAGFLERSRRLSAPGAFSFAEEYALAHSGRAAELRQAGGAHRALRLLLASLRIRPDAAGWSDLGTIYSSLGRIRASQRCFERALALAPGDVRYRSNCAVSYLYRSDLPADDIARGHRGLFRSLAGGVEVGPRPNRGGGPLRVGYVAADFRLRPLVFFLLSLLGHRNRRDFVTICYSNTRKEDEYTAMIGQLVDIWRSIRGMDDAAAASLVRSDGVDILVDCTGHFEGGRPGLFAQRPAPVQVLLLGYPATTGVPGITHRIVDRITDPPGTTESLHTETLVRLNGPYACYTPPARTPDPGPLPARQNGYLTFGCAQKRDKITARMLALWARILDAVPGSRLAFHHVFAGRPRAVRAPVERFLERRGIAPERIVWLGPADHYEHLRRLSTFDIALDTYPFNGMATTCECLWMGVPVVSLAGSSHLSRVGLSFLTAMGAGEWVAACEEDYIRKAVGLARDWAALEEIRRTLRARVERSALMDAPAYAAEVEAAFREIWRAHEGLSGGAV